MNSVSPNWPIPLLIVSFTPFPPAPARFSKLTRNTHDLTTTPFLEILNPLYDLTPPTCITAVVTEVGLIPPSSISSIPLALGKANL